MNYAPIIRFFLDKLKRDNVGAYAAQAALFVIMSVIPFLLVVTFLMRFTPITEDFLQTMIQRFIPDFAAHYLIRILSEVYNNSAKLLVPAIIIAVYSSAKFIQSLRYGLNIVYDIEETRNWFTLRFRAMLETVLMTIVLILSMLLLVFGQKIQDMLVVYAPIVSTVTDVILRLRLLVIFFILIVVFALIYKVLPNRKASLKSQLVGAVGCTAAWYIFSFGLSIYVNFFNGFSFYGSMTTILLLIFWLYICMYIFMICGEVNNVFEVLMVEIKDIRSYNKRMKAEEKRSISEGKVPETYQKRKWSDIREKFRGRIKTSVQELNIFNSPDLEPDKSKKEAIKKFSKKKH